MARVPDDGGPSAFTVKLGISTGKGRSSDPEPQTVTVNAETKVHWFFLEGAYVLHHIHGRDSSKLKEGYDLYLTRPGRGDIVLNPAREIADYGIKRSDVLEFRHKTLPIPVCINIHDGDIRKMEVNSGFPVMDIVTTICRELGIVQHAELSLAFKVDDEASGKVARMKWLDTSSSLNAQGVKDNDTLLLRKKFFVLNEDVRDALKGEVILKDLLYHQIHSQFVSDSYVGGGKEEDKTIAKVSAFLHHIEQPDENISDEGAVSKVIPKDLRKNQSLYTQIVMVYYQERVSTLQKEEAKEELLKLFTTPHSLLVTYYPVKFSEESQEYVLTVDSDTITICDETDGQLNPQQGKSWRLRELRGTECTHEDRIVKLNVLGSWQEFYTLYTKQIASYVMEAHALSKLRAARVRQSARVPTPEEPPPLSEKKEEPIPESEEPATPGSVFENGLPEPSPTVKYEWPTEDEPEQEADKKVQQEVEVALESSADVVLESSVDAEVPNGGEEVEVEEKETEVEEGKAKIEELVESKPTEIEEAGVEEEENEEEEEREEEEEEEEVRSKPSSEESIPSTGKRPVVVVKQPTLEPMTAPPPPNSPGNEEKPPIHMTPERSSASGDFHIPEYLQGLDFQTVLDDYKLFHIVVLKQDIRTLLLNIHRPVREVIDSVCSTFGISNANEYYLWIPSGIQMIIEKYGTRPKSRAGRFRKSTSSMSDFSPRLDETKTLEKQYDFKIRPYLLHLRKYQPEDDVDAPDETTLHCGEEWPDCEHPDVARYRKFYQSWIGAVQGAYPVDRSSAIKLAGLLTHVYFGDRARVKSWPPSDYDAKVFLPKKYRSQYGISSDVDKVHRELAGKTPQDCINAAIDCCTRMQTYQGIFFDVAVPVRSEIMAVIPWNKMQQRRFGINQRGIFSVEKTTGKILFTHRFSDIFEWSCTETNFHLNFKDWDEEYNAYTFQTQEIVDVLELFLDMAKTGKIRQAPARPPSLAMEGPKTPKTPASADPVFDSPQRFAAEDMAAASKKRTSSLDDSPSSKRSSTSSPTTYNVIDV